MIPKEGRIGGVSEEEGFDEVVGSGASFSSCLFSIGKGRRVRRNTLTMV